MSSKVLAGRYELIEKIGDGGMAIVYKAKDRLLNRSVAVKILKPEYLNDEKFINNFRKESHAAASLSHPNIVSIYDVGREGNINYIVMELVDGKPLSQIIRENAPLNYKLVVNYAKQIAAGLAAAHKHGIIHRDVKPHNILINEDGIAKIADFGIAKAISTTTIVDGTNETIMGSVHYFSPEQARGGYVDEKSDIYSLGIVMYEMLTGDVPFDGDNPVSVALMHISDPITPPSKLVDGIPPGLDRIVMRATDKFQSNRFKNADEMINALNDLTVVSRNVGDSVFIAQNQSSRGTEGAKRPSQMSMAGNGAGSNMADLDRPEYQRPAKKKKKWPIILIVLIALTGALAFAGIKLGIIGSANIEVPDFRGKTMEEAREIAEKKNIKVEASKFDTSENYSAGQVMSQDPDEGQMVRKNTVIKLVISKGSNNGVVPNVIGMQEDKATELLEGMGYKVKVREVNSPKSKGEVISQNPSPGTKVENGETITLSISDGKGKEEVKVPSVIGMTESDAKKTLENAGFKLGKVTEKENEQYEKGKVTEQQYEAGSMLEKGKEINLVISKGKKDGDNKPINLYIDYSQAENEVFYMTVTLSDENGTRTIRSNVQRKRSEEGESISLKGKGKGKVTVIFDNKTIMKRNVNFETGEMY